MFQTFPVCILVLVAMAHLSPGTAQGPLSPAARVKIDFSYSGYGGGAALPQVDAVLSVRPSGGDDTALLQAALDAVAMRPLTAGGFRGALQLAPGVFHVAGSLHLRASGVVLRGAGNSAGGTTILAEGTGRRTLIEVGSQREPDPGPETPITADAPAGGRVVTVASAVGLRVGDHVVVRRPSTEAWITAMGMTDLPGTFANIRLDWKPGSHDLIWDREVVAVDEASRQVTLDAPITTALEQQYGGGFLARAGAAGVPENIGVEELMLKSAYDAGNAKDEEHSWIALQFDHVANAWAQDVTARHFVSSAVRVNTRGRRITVEHSRSEKPIAEYAGYRRQGFYVAGQQVLVDRCWSQEGMNDFAAGLLAGGPNVFLDSEASQPLGPSGAFEGWASGVLYENVRIPGQRLELVLNFERAQGAGWTAANSVLWNATALSVDALGPPGAENVSVTTAHPLFARQFMERTGKAFQRASSKENRVATGAPEFHWSAPAKVAEAASAAHPVEVLGGRFVLDGRAAWGESSTEAWWRGDTSPATALQSTGSSVTRFMPGVTAPGETENLQQMALRLKTDRVLSIQVNPGLWYERRRDAHTVERRTDGAVWGPFYEMPWARSGRGTAWDGLSLYDLTRYNPWYFERQKCFAREAAEAGVLVFYDLYNTHNVLEIGPHWIDFPWRPTNNINDTGLPEPPPLRPFGRMDIGNAFFDVTNAKLLDLHRRYILHTLDVLGEQPNVIFGVAYQYAGPLAFEQFFQDTVQQWEHEHHRHVRLALTTSKETTDKILADPVRSKQIAVVDMRYWQYRPDGTLFAPKAGENHAFRELIAQAFQGYSDTPPATTAEQVYRQTREYRDRYPSIAWMPMESGGGPLPILMAGGASPSGLRSRASAPPPSAAQAAAGMYPNGNRDAKPASTIDADKVLADFIERYLAQDLTTMHPVDGWLAQPERNWVLAGGPAQPVLVYSLGGSLIEWSKAPSPVNCDLLWFDPRTGNTQAGTPQKITGSTRLAKPDDRDWLLLLRPSRTP